MSEELDVYGEYLAPIVANIRTSFFDYKDVVLAPDPRSGRAIILYGLQDDGRSLLFKCTGLNGDDDCRERIFYESDFSAVINVPICFDSSASVIVLENVAGTSVSFDNEAGCEAFFQALPTFAKELAALHNHDRRKTIPNAALPILPLYPIPVEIWENATGALRQLALLLQNDDVLRPAYAAALSEADGDDLIHGDLKPENIILRVDGRLSLIDWENFGLGNRLWDLASIVGTILLFWLSKANDTDDSPISDGTADRRFQLAKENANIFLKSYVVSSSNKESIATEKLLNLVAVWLVSRALSYTLSAVELTGYAATLLIAARGILLRPEGLIDATNSV